MKLRLLWVDDEAGFGSRQEKENWPPVMPDLLHDNAVPNGDGSFSVDGGQPASFVEIRFAPSFSAGIRLTQSHTFDLAILDMRLKSEGRESEFINDYLINKGLQIQALSARMENQMTLAFWLWRELIDRSNKVLTFFYTSYGDSSEAFVYQPFMFPDPKKEMTPAIYAKNDVSLSQRIERFLDSRALTRLASNPPGPLAKLTTELRSVERGKPLTDLLMRDSLIDSDGNQRISLADLFPALALAACTDKGGGINRHKEKTLHLLERAGARHQNCAVLARLMSPRNLDWTNRPTYGIRIVEDLSWGKKINAWPVGVGYSPLEMLSHGRTKDMNKEDWDGWKNCKDLAQAQIESLNGYLHDHDALETSRKWGQFCHELRTPFVDYATPQEIIGFKSAFRWTPHEVLSSVINGRANRWRLVSSCDHEIFGYRSSIQDSLDWFLSDLEDNSGVNDGIAAATGTTRPRTCWMFIAGEARNNRAWPHVKSEGNKLRSGLLLLTGYLIAYQFRRCDQGFEWRCFEEGLRGEHLDLNERSEIEQCVNESLARHQNVVGYAFVLPDYPPERV